MKVMTTKQHFSNQQSDDELGDGFRDRRMSML